jgi:hypothetical protein
VIGLEEQLWPPTSSNSHQIFEVRCFREPAHFQNIPTVLLLSKPACTTSPIALSDFAPTFIALQYCSLRVRVQPMRVGVHPVFVGIHSYYHFQLVHLIDNMLLTLHLILKSLEVK